MMGSRRWWWGLSGAAILVAAAGCGEIPSRGAFEKAARYQSHTPPQPANGIGMGTRGGKFPLGESSKYAHSKDRGGRSGLALNGRLNVADVQPPSEEPPQRQARSGGDVAFVPGTFDRRGFGMTARNGANMVRAGNSLRRTLSYTDPAGVQVAPHLPQTSPADTLGVGGSGQEGKTRGK